MCAYNLENDEISRLFNASLVDGSESSPVGIWIGLSFDDEVSVGVGVCLCGGGCVCVWLLAQSSFAACKYVHGTLPQRFAMILRFPANRSIREREPLGVVKCSRFLRLVLKLQNTTVKVPVPNQM